jgi:hypothetical protein
MRAAEAELTGPFTTPVQTYGMGRRPLHQDCLRFAVGRLLGPEANELVTAAMVLPI